MSEHSRFANIKYKKECNDAAKGKVSTVIDREIAVIVKEGGVDPADNSRLRDVIARVKANNMPNDTIDRGIKRAAGDTNSVDHEALTYEGYGLDGTVITVDTLTDSKNCMAADARSAFTKGGDNAGTLGSVSYMPNKKGQIIIDKEEYGMDLDELTMPTLDAEAEGFPEEGDGYEVVAVPEDLSVTYEVLETQSIPTMRADVAVIPQTWVGPADEDDIEKLNRILDLLDEDGDIQAVHHNWDE